jgi:hypothetical protein
MATRVNRISKDKPAQNRHLQQSHRISTVQDNIQEKSHSSQQRNILARSLALALGPHGRKGKREGCYQFLTQGSTKNQGTAQEQPAKGEWGSKAGLEFKAARGKDRPEASREVISTMAEKSRGRRVNGNRRSVWTIDGEDSKEGRVPSVLGG